MHSVSLTDEWLLQIHHSQHLLPGGHTPVAVWKHLCGLPLEFQLCADALVMFLVKFCCHEHQGNEDSIQQKTTVMEAAVQFKEEALRQIQLAWPGA